MFIETTLDRETIILYSSKYGKVECCSRLGGPRAGQSNRRVPACRESRAGRHAGGRNRRRARSGTEHPDISFRSAARGRPCEGSAGGSVDDLRRALRNNERVTELPDRKLLRRSAKE